MEAKIAEIQRIAKEKAEKLKDSGAYKRKRPDLLIAKFRRRIHILKTIEDRNYTLVMLGPNGDTRRKLETENECRIILKEPPDASICLCVELEAEAEENLENLTKQIKELLFDGKEPVQGIFQITDDKGDNQSKEALLKAYTMEEGEIREIYKIPNNMVGLIIGRQGETIKELISKCRAHVQVQRDLDTPAESLYREIILTGDRYSVDEAKKEIQDLIQRKTSESGVEIPEIQGGIVKQVVIPNDKAGLIIGRGGEHHRSLMSETGTAVIIPPQPDIKDPNKRTITVKGPALGVKLCCEKIMAITRGLLTATAVDVGTPYITVQVPNEKVGAIIGKGGQNLKEIQTNFGVKLQIPQRPDPDTNPPTRTLTIYGDPEMTLKARDDINTRIGAVTDMNTYMAYAQQMGYPMQQTNPMYANQQYATQQYATYQTQVGIDQSQQPQVAQQDIFQQWVQYYINYGMTPQDASNYVTAFFQQQTNKTQTENINSETNKSK